MFVTDWERKNLALKAMIFILFFLNGLVDIKGLYFLVPFAPLTAMRSFNHLLDRAKLTI